MGYVNLPCIGAEVHLPFGGVKKSGNGHPSAAGLIEAVTHKTAWTVNHADGDQDGPGVDDGTSREGQAGIAQPEIADAGMHGRSFIDSRVRSIVARQNPVLLVAHDADDGSWQFLDGSDQLTVADGCMISLQQIVAMDPTLAEVADLPLGWMAWRGQPGEPWQGAEKEEDDDDNDGEAGGEG